MRKVEAFAVLRLKDALEAFVKKTGYSVNALFLLAALLAQRECDHANEILLNWVFHNRTDPVAAKALGIVFRYLPMGLGISDGSTAGELLSEIKTRLTYNFRLCCLSG